MAISFETHALSQATNHSLGIPKSLIPSCLAELTDLVLLPGAHTVFRGTHPASKEKGAGFNFAPHLIL
jgi:hypothetical protein